MNNLLKSRSLIFNSLGISFNQISLSNQLIRQQIFNTQCFGFTASVKRKLYDDRIKVKISEKLGKIEYGPQRVIIKKNKKQTTARPQPIPRHDYIMFKQMSGNEILLNLDNCENLRNSELVSGLIELAKRDKNKEHDWNNHPITVKCLESLRERLPRLNAKNVIQTPMILDRLNIIDQELWNQTSQKLLKLLHKYKGRDLSQMLDLYDKDILDEEGEPYSIKKTDHVFFERVVGLLPIQVKYLNNEQLIRTIEVLVRKEIGSERLFRDFLLLKVEKNILKFNPEQYKRLLIALADKQYAEDYVLWTQFILKYPFESSKKNEERFLTPQEAKMIWDAFFYVKLKCPTIDVNEALVQVEKFMPSEDDIQLKKANI